MSEKSLQRCRDGAIWAVAAMLLGWSHPVSACAVKLGAVTTAAITYDPFRIALAEGIVRVGVDLAEGDRCDAVIALTDEAGAPLRTLAIGPTRAVMFQPLLRTGPGVSASLDPSAAAVSLSAAQSHADIEWRIASTSAEILPPGDYAIGIRARVESPTTVAPPSIGVVTVRSVARAEIALAGTAVPFASGGDAATIDLGELRTGGTGHAFILLRANTQASLSFTSRNLGNLAQFGGPGRVPYRLSFDGRDVDLRQASSRAVDPPSTMRGASFPLTVTVGDITGAPAGAYSDVVVIDVSP